MLLVHVIRLTLFIVLAASAFHGIRCQNLSGNHAFALENATNCIPKSIQLYEHEILFVKANCSELNFTYLSHELFEVFIEDKKIAVLLDPRSETNRTDIGDAIVIQGVFLGRTQGILRLKGSKVDEVVKIAVIRRERIVDHLFVVIVTMLMMLAYVGMGCAVDIGTVKEVLKKPVAPTIGFLSQYIIMPLAAFGAVKLFGLSGGIALGFFASGCAPGGGASNMYTYLLGGDSSLSVTMTLISTIASLGMFPLWLHTLGRLVYDNHGSPLRVPFTNIFTSLAVMIVPLAVGAIVKIKRPQWAERVRKIMRPFFAIIIILLITLGTWSNLYLFQLITPWLILGACLLSYSGFILGGVLAFACRLKWSRVIAVAIETGVQNTGLPILLLKFSLPQPDADLSVVSPVAVAMLMPIPLWIAIAVLEIRKKCKGTPPSVPLVNSESEVKMLKSFETNGGPPNHVVEVNEVNDCKVDLNKSDAETKSGSQDGELGCVQEDGAEDSRFVMERF